MAEVAQLMSDGTGFSLHWSGPKERRGLVEQGTGMGDGGVSAYPVIGVGDVHGGDAQEVNEGCVVAARTQSAQAAGRKMFRLQGAGPAHQPGVHIPALGSPGDQAVHRAATVGISDRSPLPQAFPFLGQLLALPPLALSSSSLVAWVGQIPS